MTKTEKQEVEDHIIKTAGFDQTTKGYHAIKQLFYADEWDLYSTLEVSLYQGLALWLQQIGLLLEIRSYKINLHDDAVISYYENVMGKKATPDQPEQSYYERYNINVKKD